MEAVFDCSAIIACLAPDEHPPRRWRVLLAEAELIAPPLLPTELANALCAAHRRGRLDGNQLALANDRLKALAIRCEPAAVTRSVDEVQGLALTHGLTVYDAAYLELAHRRRLPLATLDDDLRKAAKKARVKLI